MRLYRPIVFPAAVYRPRYICMFFLLLPPKRQISLVERDAGVDEERGHFTILLLAAGVRAAARPAPAAGLRAVARPAPAAGAANEERRSSATCASFSASETGTSRCTVQEEEGRCKQCRCGIGSHSYRSRPASPRPARVAAARCDNRHTRRHTIVIQAQVTLRPLVMTSTHRRQTSPSWHVQMRCMPQASHGTSPSGSRRSRSGAAAALMRTRPTGCSCIAGSEQSATIRSSGGETARTWTVHGPWRSEPSERSVLAHMTHARKSHASAWRCTRPQAMHVIGMMAILFAPKPSGRSERCGKKESKNKRRKKKEKPPHCEGPLCSCSRSAPCRDPRFRAASYR